MKSIGIAAKAILGNTPNAGMPRITDLTDRVRRRTGIGPQPGRGKNRGFGERSGVFFPRRIFLGSGEDPGQATQNWA